MSKVCQLFSGSSGNSILISAKGKNFLVDIGVSAKRCELALFEHGTDPKSIDAVFVTHEHSDHTKGIKVFSGKYNIPVFAPEACIEEMNVKGIIDSRVHTEEFENTVELSGIEIKGFHQSHDSVDCLGYRFDLPNGKSAAVCTDTGYVTDNAKQICSGVDLIFIESNHEVSMVETGPYPYPLKQRILGINGHLSNFACGEYIKELAQSGTTRFVLSHLSRENNTPHIAKQTAVSALSEVGMEENTDYRLYVSPPENLNGVIAL